MVWIYGGGFETGSAATDMTNPRRFASEERCIVVAANYRVGALGFAHLTHRGGPFASAANLGLTDVIASLAWVRDNIAEFGGNPAAVTVMGQSAGGFLAGALLGAPSANGLFHQLVLMSGGTSRIVPAAAAEQMGDELLTELARLIGTADLHQLATAPANAVLAAQQTVPARDIGVRNGAVPHAFGVVHDGTVLTDHPQQVVEAGQAAGIAIMTGATEREVAAFRMATAEPFAPDGATGMVDEITTWGADAERAERIVSDYLQRTGSADAAREALLTDWIYRLPAARLARAQAVAGGRAWAYTADGGDALGPAGHTADLPLVFGTADTEPIRTLMGYPPAGHAARTAAGSVFRDALGLFIRTSDPGFEPWSSTNHPTLVIGDTAAIDPDRYAHVLRLWEGIPRP
jgi:para-nitrobenzyl esterase